MLGFDTAVVTLAIPGQRESFLEVRSVKRRSNREQGASLVEFALILPVFMALILGMFTGGLAYNRKQQLTHAAREGARYGATLPEDAGCVDENGTDSWTECVQELVFDRAAGDVEAEADICVALVTGDPATPVDASHTTDSGGNSCFTDSGGDDDDRVQVRVTRDTQLEVLFFSTPLTLKSRATAKYEASSS
jgi:hypothetical protein